MGRHFPPPRSPASANLEALRRSICTCFVDEWAPATMVAVARELMRAIDVWPAATLSASKTIADELIAPAPCERILRRQALSALSAPDWPGETLVAIAEILKRDASFRPTP